MNFIPQTVVKLLSGVPLDNEYHDTLDFEDVASQTTFFMGFNKYTFTDFTYQRERGAIRVPLVYDLAISCNYVAYQNSNFTNKWFYAFVTEVNYLSPDTSEVVIETDVMQTWQFNYTFLPSFIERETVSDDNLYAHTIPESIEFGPVLSRSSEFYDLNELIIVIAFSPTEVDFEAGQMMDGVYTGLKYMWFGTSSWQVQELNDIIDSFARAGQLEAIVSIFMVPKKFLDRAPDSFLVFHTTDSIDGYVPKNKKLFCFPYTYFTIGNCKGTENIYKYELFSNPNYFRIRVNFSFNMQSACVAIPLDYNGIEQDWTESITITDFPVCSWVGNVYANWKARNALTLTNTALTLGTNAVMAGVNTYFTGNPGPTISAAQQVFSTVAQIGDRSMFPQGLQGQVNCDVSAVNWDRVGFELKSHSIRKEYAVMIDNYFSMYGYKVNRVGYAQTKTRESWNYIKTIDVKIRASIPVEHINKIKSIYDKGVTFWHGNYVGDYSRSNNIINPPPPPVYPDPPDPPDPPTPPEIVWGWPMIGWQDHVTSEWGWRVDPISGGQKFHNGMDIGQPEGTPILAIAGGVVDAVTETPARGKYVDIVVNSSTFYRYQHCQTISVTKGQTITLEQEVATVGTTGQVTGPHLHVEIFINGGTVNPRNYMVEKS